MSGILPESGGGLRAPGMPPPGTEAEVGRELFVRHARRDGRSVAILRAVDYGTSCVVDAEVYPAGAVSPVQPGPYKFMSAQEATAFVTEAVEALMYLGCDIQAQ